MHEYVINDDSGTAVNWVVNDPSTWQPAPVVCRCLSESPHSIFQHWYRMLTVRKVQW